MAPEELEDLFNRAYMNAIEHGCGFIRVLNTPTSFVVDVIEPEEYLSLSTALQWAAEQAGDKPKQ